MKNEKLKMKNGREILNTMRLEIPAISENESFARGVVSAFATQINPTMEEIDDIKTAVSEAVTNCVVHAYQKRQSKDDKIIIECAMYDGEIEIKITDNGVGIPDIKKAMQPFFTTILDGERSGMGFTVMESFTDYLCVNNNVQGGTVVIMKKFFTKEERKVSGS
ncbi:MAG: anti-sigma F factor [Christensenellaceae bacterium]|jgi:stage II sporulation protein AB (anti-sigma F factor)|nr:anti-sigma F factor [Christensenellaceae bacterium]